MVAYGTGDVRHVILQKERLPGAPLHHCPIRTTLLLLVIASSCSRLANRSGRLAVASPSSPLPPPAGVPGVEGKENSRVVGAGGKRKGRSEAGKQLSGQKRGGGDIEIEKQKSFHGSYFQVGRRGSRLWLAVGGRGREDG